MSAFLIHGPVAPVKAGGNKQPNPRFLQILLKQTVRQRPQDLESVSISVSFTAATKIAVVHEQCLLFNSIGNANENRTSVENKVVEISRGKKL